MGSCFDRKGHQGRVIEDTMKELYDHADKGCSCVFHDKFISTNTSIDYSMMDPYFLMVIHFGDTI